MSFSFSQEEKEKRISQLAKEQVYDTAWDSKESQIRLEEQLTFARKLSNTSDPSDTFHDAFDSIPTGKVSIFVNYLIFYTSNTTFFCP